MENEGITCNRNIPLRSELFISIRIDEGEKNNEK